MDLFQTELGPLFLLVFTLGVRHGLDADHLATIDGLVRFNSAANHRLARWCGILFSVGHGLIVTSVAVTVCLFAGRWVVPTWIDVFGAWVSIIFLILLGTLNLIAVIGATDGQIVTLVGLKAGWLSKLQSTDNPLLIMLVGALFALSFDTLSQAAMFALAGSHQGGIWHTVVLGAGFTLGMMLADGLNGLWISRLLARSDSLACIASRIMGVTVAFLSFAIAAIGIGKFTELSVSEEFENHGVVISIGIVAILLGAFILASRSASRSGSSTATNANA